ncbi:MAG TPA: hypothetical protein VJN93_16485 [Candidatus Acidoferrum sp.]|nr:hypothetical protein [Candidatus Acidoferrum sp.]
MNQLQKGLLFAVLQVALVCSLGAKLMWDRETLPRGWAATHGYDPNMPIRGRYINISLVVRADRVFPKGISIPGTPAARAFGPQNVYLTVENGNVVANLADRYTGLTLSDPVERDGELLATLYPPVVYFLPEHAADPMRAHPGSTPMLEVTIPKKGPPRPIRFGITEQGRFLPLDSE